jgi:hypothetical protein
MGSFWIHPEPTHARFGHAAADLAADHRPATGDRRPDRVEKYGSKRQTATNSAPDLH